VFAAMPNGDGYAGFSDMFALQSLDGVRWDNLGAPNPDVKRSRDDRDRALLDRSQRQTIGGSGKAEGRRLHEHPGRAVRWDVSRGVRL
jgi:hypothetical protein